MRCFFRIHVSDEICTWKSGSWKTFKFASFEAENEECMKSRKKEAEQERKRENEKWIESWVESDKV